MALQLESEIGESLLSSARGSMEAATASAAVMDPLSLYPPGSTLAKFSASCEAARKRFEMADKVSSSFQDER